VATSHPTRSRSDTSRRPSRCARDGGALGFVLAAAFVRTGGLLVVVAHYLVNALEFVVHEGLGLEWERDEQV
jgi:hypothetical protein